MTEKNRSKKQKTEIESDFSSYKQSVIKGLMEGQPLIGDGGLLKPLIAEFVEGALSGEMDHHLLEERTSEKANRRNGKLSKTIRTTLGEVDITYDRDREGSFDPITVKKRQYQLANGLDDQILELYAMSNSISDIQLHLNKMYGVQMSEGRISSVVNSVWDRVQAWKNRPLSSCYVVMFIDAVHLDVRRNGQVIKIALYVLYGINVEGQRDIIGLYPGQGCESATEWARCLQSVKDRGLEDVFIICSDGLSGLKEVMQEVYPQAKIQRCVVHKIRNCFKFIDEKDRKKVLGQLRGIYTATNEAEARLALDDFAQYWDGKYDVIVKLWEKDWKELMTCMELGPTLKKLTYTTNAIENLNREIRRVTKSKGAWVSDKALMIQLFLSLERKKKSWNKKVRGWANVKRELSRTYGDRFDKHIF